MSPPAGINVPVVKVVTASTVSPAFGEGDKATEGLLIVPWTHVNG